MDHKKATNSGGQKSNNNGKKIEMVGGIRLFFPILLY